jgi:RNA polymerase sigma-70 factor (ECF subfamily)
LDDERSRLRSIILGHLDAAHNLAWWLTGNEPDAADVVQSACLKAWRFSSPFRGGDSKSWFLAIVRNAARDRRREQRREQQAILEVSESHAAETTNEPFTELAREIDRAELEQAIQCLPDHYREVLILREFEGLTYAQIGAVVDAPIGTVMSRLSRARDAVQQALRRERGKE